MFIEPRDCNVSVITIVKNFIRKIILTNTSLIRSIINSIIIPSVSVSSCKTNANIITITNTRNISKAGILSLSIYSNIIFFRIFQAFLWFTYLTIIFRSQANDAVSELDSLNISSNNSLQVWGFINDIKRHLFNLKV